ncbi:MAG: hypothetical protein M3Q81_00770 [bacterium]|nr:hypothetical protein [bacterium]
MENEVSIVNQVVTALFAVDSIWSVVIRGAVWLAIALVIIVSSDTPNPEKSLKSMRSNLGFLLFFVVLSGSLIYLLFGFTSQPG